MVESIIVVEHDMSYDEKSPEVTMIASDHDFSPATKSQHESGTDISPSKSNEK